MCYHEEASLFCQLVKRALRDLFRRLVNVYCFLEVLPFPVLLAVKPALFCADSQSRELKHAKKSYMQSARFAPCLGFVLDQRNP